MLTGCARVFLIFERRPREGRLIQDLIVGVIYLGAALSVVAYVFNAPVGTLIATSGVFAIILGLALQSTLADVFSGIALNLSKAYEVGDWIVLSDGIEGRVVETNWRPPTCSTPRTTSSCCPTAAWPRRSSPISAAPTAATA